MAETKPRAEQVRFVSDKTGAHILDEYIEACERNGVTLSSMIDTLFDANGVFRQDVFQFRIKDNLSDDYTLQFRAGTFVDPEEAWVDISEDVFTQILLASKNYRDQANTARLAAEQAVVDAAIQVGLAEDQVTLAQDQVTLAAAQVTLAAAQATLAQNWAILTSGPVSGGEYSAKYHAQASAASAVTAASARDAAQAAANGMKWRPSVRFATIANDTLSGLAARNGITPVAGNRVLVTAQTTQSQNGVYIAASGAWTRATDADTWAELVSQVVVTEEASTISGITDVAYICTVNNGGTLGTTAVTWAPLPAAITDGSIEAVKLSANARIEIRQIPQNSRSADYTFALSDGGCHIYHPSADTAARSFTIPANSTVAFPIGTAITVINDTGAGEISINILTDILMMAGSGLTGPRTLAQNGMATMVKVTATKWVITGTGLI